MRNINKTIIKIRITNLKTVRSMFRIACADSKDVDDEIKRLEDKLK